MTERTHFERHTGQEIEGKPVLMETLERWESYLRTNYEPDDTLPEQVAKLSRVLAGIRVQGFELYAAPDEPRSFSIKCVSCTGGDIDEPLNPGETTNCKNCGQPFGSKRDVRIMGEWVAEARDVLDGKPAPQMNRQQRRAAKKRAAA